MTVYARRNEQLDWLLATFVRNTPGVVHAVVVSGDGLQLAASDVLETGMGDQLSAATSGLVSLAGGVAQLLRRGPMSQVIVEMGGGHLFLTPLHRTPGLGMLAVVADRQCDMGMIGYEMTMLAAQMGHVLTPAARTLPGRQA